MRFLEEEMIKTNKDIICQKCGKDVLKGQNALREKYIHQGKIITTMYCSDSKCNPLNDLGYKMFIGAIVIVIAMFVWIVN